MQKQILIHIFCCLHFLCMHMYAHTHTACVCVIMHTHLYEWELKKLANTICLMWYCRSSDAYCFELLSMVLALSGSAVGRNYLARQHSLLQDMLSLMHTSTPRVQRQVGHFIILITYTTSSVSLSPNTWGQTFIKFENSSDF